MYLVSQHEHKSVKCDGHDLVAWAVLPCWEKSKLELRGRLVLPC